MTEEEAKAKWCPFAMAGSTTSGLGGFNRFIEPVKADSEKLTRCIGSACMAWRWESDADYEDRFIEWEDSANIGGVQRGPEPIRIGHCGLAGRP